MVARLVAFILPLGFDTLAVALALGLRGVRPLRPALVFSAFEAIVPLFGFALGRFAGARFAAAAALAGGIVLIGVGVLALREAREHDDHTGRLAFDSWRAAAAAGLAVSLDELAVGFPLGTARLPLGTLLGALAIQTFVVTYAGIAIGHRVRATLGRRAVNVAGAAAGFAFCALGLWFVFETLFGSRPVP